MGSVRNFEELVAWQVARELVKLIYLLSKKGDFSRDFRLSAQIQAAAISVSSNIAEGFERGSAADFHKFLVTAKASCAEVRSQLHNAHDVGYLSDSEFDQAHTLAQRTALLVGGLRAAVRRRI